MFLRFKEGNQDLSFKRAQQAGLTFESRPDLGPDAAELAQIKAVDSGFQLHGAVYDEETGILSTAAAINVRKHAVVLTMYPGLAQLLTQPMLPTTLADGDFGEIPLGRLDADDLAAVKALPWLVRVHFVLVNTPYGD